MEERDNKAGALAAQVLELVGQKIRVNLRFLAPALDLLDPENYEGTLATDGLQLYYNPSYLVNAYAADTNTPIRAELHLLMHCVFRHFFVGKNIDKRRWNLACDIAVENLILSWKNESIRGAKDAEKKRGIDRLSRTGKTLTAERVYALLERVNDREFAELEKLFAADDHSLWYGGTSESGETVREISRTKMQEIEEIWSKAAGRIATGLETFLKGRTSEAGDMLMQLQIRAQKRGRYSDFLRKFSVLCEQMRVSDEEFDYNYYTYGLSLYGNVPLIEPLEYREEQAIRDFAVVIDTSGSVEPERIKKYLTVTGEIILDEISGDTNLHIIQCDAEVQSDLVVGSARELACALTNFHVKGRGGTDFRPAFEYVDRLIEGGRFRELQGLLYFTDGMGTFPRKRTPYHTAFIIDGEMPAAVPAWAMRLNLREIE